MALQSSGVAFRKVLAHFPEELSLAFAYGSGVFRQAGPSSHQKVRPAPCPKSACSHGLPLALDASRALQLRVRALHGPASQVQTA